MTNDYETSDYKTNDYETNDYKTNDYKTNDYKTNDYETNDYKTNDYLTKDYLRRDWMVKIGRFEDVNSWQKARVLANFVYTLTSKPDFNRDFRLRDQIQGAAGSVMHNIAEGFDAGSDAEFIRFLKYARRSASEVQSQLYLALDQGYIAQADMQKAYDLATEVKRLVNGLIAYLRGNNQLREPSPEYSLDTLTFEDDPLDDDYPPSDYPPSDYPTNDYPTNDY